METPTGAANTVTDRTVPRTNGLTEERKRLLRAAGRHKNNPEYIERGRQGVAEYRQQLQEELEHELAEEESK